MKKKIYLLVIVALLVVSMLCMFACNSTNTSADKNNNKGEDGNSLVIGENGNVGNGGTVRINANSKTAFQIYSKESTTVQKVVNKIEVTNQKGNAQNVTVVATSDSGHYFKVCAPIGGYAPSSYYDIVIDDSLSFISYEGAKKVSFYVPAKTSTIDAADYKENVVSVAADFITDLTMNETTETYRFNYAYAATGVGVEVDDVLIAESEASQTAYLISSVKDNNDGTYTCTAKKPQSDDVYTALVVKDQATLSNKVAENVAIDDNAKLEEELSEIAALSFGVGVAKFDIDCQLNDGDVVATVKMTIPDVVEVDGQKVGDITMTFKIYSQINVTTDLAVGSNVTEIVSAAKKGVNVKADFDNTLEFSVGVGDTINVSEVSNLDTIIKQIYDMVNGVQDSDVEITLFNWIIPIGDGIASIKFDTKVAMDFAFGGELNVTSTSNLKFSTTAIYNPENEEDKFDVAVSDPSFEFESLTVEAKGAAHSKIGLAADLDFDLLGGVLSIGLGATVGNYNDIYLDAITGNLIKDGKFDVAYGFYFEGGVYYNVSLKYNVPNLLKGKKLLVDEKALLYDAGDQLMVKDITTKRFVVGAAAMDLVVYGTQKNIVTGEVKTNSLINVAKVALIDDNNYLALVDGQIVATADGIDAKLNNYEFTLKVDGKEYTCFADLANCVEASVNEANVIKVGTGLEGKITCKYIDSELAFEPTYAGESITITPERVGTIIVYVDGVATMIISVK